MTGSNLGQRLAERAAAGSPPPAPTARDEENLIAFETALDRLSDLLEQEIAALAARDLNAVEALLTKKTGLVAALERVAPLVEPFLPGAGRSDLFDRMNRLRQLAEEDRRGLDRLADAARTITAEHARILDRHSLNGIYERSGRKLGASRPGPRGFDESH